MNDVTQLDSNVRALDGELFDRLALNPDGEPFDDNDPEAWGAADEAQPEVVHLGAARFKVVDADALVLAVAAGAVDEGSPQSLCLRVAFESSALVPTPVIGQFVVVATDEPNVSIVFRICATHAELHDPASPDLGPYVVRNAALDALEVNQALLVQVLDEFDAVAA